MRPSGNTEQIRYLRSVPPTKTLELGRDLSLSPRLKLLLTFFRSDPAVKPVDEWKLKAALLDFLRSSSSYTLPLCVVDDDDLFVRRRPDLHKRKRDEPVASGTLFFRDLVFLQKNSKAGEEEDEDEEVLRRKFLDWRDSVVERLGGIELNLEGVKFRMTVEIPHGDDFGQVKKSWGSRKPDTIVVRGIPSRWFAEPLVSSKASALVIHTLFSVIGEGEVRNIKVAEDDDLGNKTEGKGEIVSGLNCKVWVQFENHNDFCNAMKLLCGRSMQKQGSRLKVEYEVTWDRDGIFHTVQNRPARSQGQETFGSTRGVRGLAGNMRNQASWHQPHVIHSDSNGVRHKRFRD